MLALAAGMFFGVIGGFQFLFPDFLQELLFTKTRPLHVSLVVSWIFLIAIGGIYFYLPRQCRYTLWSERAALSRHQAGIPHTGAHMAVLVQRMIRPDLSFILHTVNPINSYPREVYIELAMGLGETLASGATRGTPWRVVCNKESGRVDTLALANFTNRAENLVTQVPTTI